MAHTPKPGHQPTDAEIAAHGPKAFAPRRDPFVPTVEQLMRAARDVLPNDASDTTIGEYEALAASLQVSQLAQQWYAAMMCGALWCDPGYWDDEDDAS